MLDKTKAQIPIQTNGNSKYSFNGKKPSCIN